MDFRHHEGRVSQIAGGLLMVAATSLESKLDRIGGPTDSGCTEWLGPTDWDGYGLVGHRRKTFRVHRLIYERHTGAAIPAGLVVRHVCDNPPCVNPEHLILGTAAENNHDRVLRGRSADRRGEKCPTAKLTWADVHEIRRLLALGSSHTSIAPRFGVTRECISRISRNEIWKESS